MIVFGGMAAALMISFPMAILRRTLRTVRDEGVAILVVDKNIDDLLALCDRHIILVKGEVVFEGSSAALRDDPKIIHTHLGI